MTENNPKMMEKTNFLLPQNWESKIVSVQVERGFYSCQVSTGSTCGQQKVFKRDGEELDAYQ